MVVELERTSMDRVAETGDELAAEDTDGTPQLRGLLIARDS